MIFVIILWLIVIIFIAECACPGFIWVTLGALAVSGAIYFGIMYLVDKIKNRKTPKNKTKIPHKGLGDNQRETFNTPKPSNVTPSSNFISSNDNIKPSGYANPTPIAPVKININGVPDDERSKIIMGFDLENILIDGMRHKITVIDELNDSEYAVAKLMKSNYPFSWGRTVESEVREAVLLIEYRLPSIEEIPDFAEIEFKNNNPVAVSPNDKRIKAVWSDICYKIAIRSLFELFSSYQLADIESINFNGIVKSLDLATGNESEKCIMSIIVKRNDFEKLDLCRVDAKQCFKRFKGISAHDLSTLTPIPPLMSMNKNDKRFSDSYDVISNIESGENLAAMDWRDFENLIRELFEKEFSESGSEVKITRASKDGGVDAVVFDSDPIRGGKIIIQAKRYTNVVGVSAVRDLYGTVMNEGATKGILVTTSDYGSDSYNFAKDKPLTLLNGANLLHLLGKHGCKARINIVEAKKLLNATTDE